MSVRAGIVVTGTEVLSGRVSDRNGPWVSERLLELGVELAHITVVGDRPEDVRAVLDWMAAESIDLIVTSGGLGPTADDLTAEVVGAFQGRRMLLDEALSARIAEIVAPLMRRWPDLDPAAIEAANRKQATIPEGAEILEPVGTAPGLVVTPAGAAAAGAVVTPAAAAVVTPAGAGPTVVVLPGPPRELQPMWRQALESESLRAVLSRATVYRQRTMRLFGIPESEIAETLRAAEADGIELVRLEVTTCLKRGEIEIVTRYEPADAPVYEAFESLIAARHADTLFSADGSTVDDQVAALLLGSGADGAVLREGPALTVATAESCTGGLIAARLTDRPGSSRYVRGGIVAYDNIVKTRRAAVPGELIEAHGAVSQQVAEALAAGARSELEADVGVGITGVAGPGGGTAEKPVGLVWLSVCHDGPGGPAFLTRSVTLPGGRADVRDRATSVSMHLLRRALLGAQAPPLPLAQSSAGGPTAPRP